MFKFTMLIALCSVLTACGGSKTQYSHPQFGVVGTSNLEFKKASQMCEDKIFETPRTFYSPGYKGLLTSSEPKDVQVRDMRHLMDIVLSEHKLSQPSYALTGVAVAQGDVQRAVKTATPTPTKASKNSPAQTLFVQLLKERSDCLQKKGWDVVKAN